MKRVLSLLLVIVVCLSLCACGKADNYEAAIALMEAENYDEAIALFADLGNYEDSVQKLEECTNIKAYNDASELYESGKFSEALAIFSTLGNYKDSIEKVAECEAAIAYENAMVLLNDGQYEQAYTEFLKISDYKDVPEILSHFTEVEITVDNWQNYFTIAEVPLYTKNDFNEVISIYFKNDLVLTEDSAARIFNLKDSKVIFEFSIKTTAQYIDFDKNSGEYTSVEATEYKWNEEITTTHTWEFSAEDHTIYCSSTIEAAPMEGQEPIPEASILIEEVAAIRAQGSIFIYN